MRILRKNVLLLNNVIERGLMVKEGDNSSSLLNSVLEEIVQEIRTLASDYLRKAGLTELAKADFIKA